jgi:pimeloyl-ACP methyl ester carboxylesterase
MVMATPLLASAATTDAPAGVKNIVIVHGAFTDGSGWRAVEDILYHKGYTVRVVQPPMTSYDDDVAAVRTTVVAAGGPVVLVGQDYGGSVITQAGARPKVKAVVYVAGFEPDVFENVPQLMSSMPEPTDDLITTRDGHILFNPAKFTADYAGDVDPDRAHFWAVSEVPATVAAFGGSPSEIAWRQHPSYAIVATDDRVISPDLQRWMAKRAGSTVTEIKASHAVEISHPDEVAKVIEDAALNAK